MLCRSKSLSDVNDTLSHVLKNKYWITVSQLTKKLVRNNNNLHLTVCQDTTIIWLENLDYLSKLNFHVFFPISFTILHEISYCEDLYVCHFFIFFGPTVNCGTSIKITPSVHAHETAWKQVNRLSWNFILKSVTKIYSSSVYYHTIVKVTLHTELHAHRNNCVRNPDDTSVSMVTWGKYSQQQNHVGESSPNSCRGQLPPTLASVAIHEDQRANSC